MGRKRIRKRKQIYFCLAVVIVLTPLGCTLGKIVDLRGGGKRLEKAEQDNARRHLTLSRKYFSEGKYQEAVKENNQVLSLVGKYAPADESLFNLGLIYAYPANPDRDYGKSISYFRQLIRDNQQSPLIEEARTMFELLQENEQLNALVGRLNRIIRQSEKDDAEKNRIITNLMQENEKLNGAIKELNNIIEQSRRVDIKIEEQRREKLR